MSTTFQSAPEVKEVADELIPLYHPHLQDARIEYVFSSTVSKKGGKEVWGTMRKITSLTAYLGGTKNEQDNGATGPFFVMTISKPVWEELDSTKKKALVDHELCHAFVKLDEEGEAKLDIVPHDLEEFKAIVERYGLWRDDVKDFVKATKGGKKSEGDETEQEEVAF